MTIANKNRDVSLDLLRIVSMLLIVFLHSIDHSGVLETAETAGTGMFLYVRFTYMLCQVCVNIYVMLSGYFLVNATFRFQKLVTLWMETAFYSFVLKLIFMLSGTAPFSVFSLAACLFPITTGRYWFLTIYVGLYLIFPFLNILIRAMDRRQHGLLNVSLFLIMSVWVSVHPALAGMNSGGGWGLAWFVVLYLAAAWMRLYYSPNGKYGRWLGLYIFIALAVALLQVAVRGLDISLLRRVVNHWFRYDSAPVYIMTMCLFTAFLNMRIAGAKVSGITRFCAPLTLGVYLIHAHANVSPWSWEVLSLPGKMGSPLFPLIQLGSVILIFSVCAAVDALCRATVGRLENLDCLRRACAGIQSGIGRKLSEWFEG